MRFLALLVFAALSGAHAQGIPHLPPEAKPAKPAAPPPSLTKPPRLIRSTPAPYPPKALTEGRAATVVLQLDVDATGKVVAASVLAGAGAEFDEPALAAARAFEFTPGEAGGKPVPVRITYRYRFQIEDRKTERPAEASRAVSFRGKLLERGTRTPLGGVRVYVLGTGEVERTDAQGAFALAGLSPGKYQITARTPAHERLTAEIRVPFSAEGAGTFYLRRRPYDPYETVIRAPREREQVVQRTIRLEEISRIPGIQGDALKVVQNLPGVARVPFGLGALVIRGSAPQDSSAFLDGHPIPLLFHFLGLRSVFNSDILSRIDFLPGNFPDDYGRFTGGILDVWTRPGKRDGYHGFVDVNIFDTGVLLEGPIGDGSFTLSARRSYIDAVLPLVVSSSSTALTVAPYYYDYQATLTYPLGRGHELKILFYGSEDRLSFLRTGSSTSSEIRGDYNNDILFHRFQGAWSYKQPDFENRLSWSVGIDRILLEISANTRIEAIRDLNFVSLRDDARWRLAPTLLLGVGLDVQLNNERFGGTLPQIPTEGESPRIILDNPTTGESRDFYINPAIYATLAWQVTPDITVTPQVRFDYWSRMHRGTFDPRLTLRFRLRGETTFLAVGAGIFHQSPFFDQLSPIFGNPDLHPSMATHYSVAVSHRFTEALSLDFTVFYKNLSDLVVRSDTPVTRDGKVVSQKLSNDGKGEVYGIELLLRHQLYRGLFGWLGYTLERSTRQDEPGGPYRIFAFDQTHILTAILSYKFGWGWQIGVRWRYVTGFPYTPYVGGLYDADADRYRPIPGPQLSARIPAFHQLDLRIDKEWAFERWRFSIYLDIQNVYNQQNPEAVRYNFDFTQKLYLTGLPIVPALGLRGDF